MMSPKATDSPPGRGKEWVKEASEHQKISRKLETGLTHPQPLPGGEFTAAP
jgi:hypothetical protein